MSILLQISFQALRLQCFTVPVWVGLGSWVGLAINITRVVRCVLLQETAIGRTTPAWPTFQRAKSAADTPKCYVTIRNTATSGSGNAPRSYEAMRPA